VILAYALRFGRILAFLMFSFTALAQSTPTDSVAQKLGTELNKIFSTDVQMEIDTLVFNSKQNNFYFNEAENAMIMTLVAPQSFAKAEEHFNKRNDKESYKSLDKKKFVHDGRNFLYEKGMIENDGKKAFMYVYAIEVSAQSTIFFTGMHMEGGEQKFFPVIQRAALSARLK
jgi:hypothetical protein